MEIKLRKGFLRICQCGEDTSSGTLAHILGTHEAIHAPLTQFRMWQLDYYPTPRNYR